MERWEGYLLGALGLVLAFGSVAIQIASFAAGRITLALTATLGVAGGAILYRTGYRGIAR